MKYNYLESIKEDVKNYIEENKENENYNFDNIEEVKELLYDDLWADDSVTGNGSGSYYCNAYKAREALQGNEELLIEALETFGNDAESYKRSLIDPEFADVTIRCYLLSQAIDEVVEEMTKKSKERRKKKMKNERIKKEFIIGGSKDLHNVFTMELEITYRNNYQEFTASFNEGELVNIDERNEDARGYYEEMFDCVDNESKLYYLQDRDRTKEEWIDACIAEEYDYRDRIDCSCTDYEIERDGITYNFETVGCGQHDPRDTEYFIPVNGTVDKLLKFWDKHHLKEITDEEKNELLKLCEKMEKYENIEEYIEENIEL